jgi:hypothetical protein
MKKDQNQYHSAPIPIRLDLQQIGLLDDFQAKTGLSKSFIIRRCVTYALEKFAADEVNVLTLREKE